MSSITIHPCNLLTGVQEFTFDRGHSSLEKPMDLGKVTQALSGRASTKTRICPIQGSLPGSSRKEGRAESCAPPTAKEDKALR